jgi:hypothetical protein
MVKLGNQGGLDCAFCVVLRPVANFLRQLKEPFMNLHVLAAITVATLTASPAFAGSTSSATLGSFSWQLVDLNPLDNVAPSITFFTGGRDSASASTRASQSNPFDQQSQDILVDGSWAPVTSFSSTSQAWATATVTNSDIGSAVLSASGAAATPFSAYSHDYANYTGQVFIYTKDGSHSSFSLSANTLVTFSAVATISGSAQAGGSPQGAHALARAWFDAYGPGSFGGGFQSSNDYAYQDVYDYGNSPQSFSESRTLRLSFLNLTAGDMNGQMYAGVDVDGYSYAVPVPEPESYALLLAGLGLLGFIAKRKKLV